MDPRKLKPRAFSSTVSTESYTSAGQLIFIPDLTPYNKKLLKLPVARGGIRFPVNGNVTVNKDYMDEIDPGNVSLTLFISLAKSICLLSTCACFWCLSCFVELGVRWTCQFCPFSAQPCTSDQKARC